MTEERIQFNDDGRMFIPLNMEGEKEKTSNFWHSGKTMAVFGIVAMFALGNIFLAEWALIPKIIANIVFFIIGVYIVRFYILRERYLKKVYKVIEKYQKATSGIYWGIAFIKETKLGSLVYFIDGKVGCFLRLDRGSVVGQPKEFMSRHYDAVSDFYKSINEKDYKTVFISTMEKASKDNRLELLAKSIKDERNESIRELLNLDLAYIRGNEEATLYETDRILVYSENVKVIDKILNDVTEASSKLLQGAYMKVKIMDEAEIIDLHKETEGVGYFNLTNAKADLFNYDSASTDIEIVNIKLNNDRNITVRQQENKIILDCYNRFNNGEKDIDVLAELRNKKENEEIEFTDLKEETTEEIEVKKEKEFEKKVVDAKEKEEPQAKQENEDDFMEIDI